MSRITFVKKILLNGDQCKKCFEMQEKLEKSGNIKYINRTVIALEGNPESEGMILAKKFSVDRAPFLIYENDTGEPKILTTYSDFIREALHQTPNKEEEIKDFFKSNNDLDFI